MIKKNIDLHIHSKYSRACSKDLNIPNLAVAAKLKGLDILTTGDITHPGWFSHLQENLVEVSQGLYESKEIKNGVKFILGGEISCIKKDRDKVRRIHVLVFAQDFTIAEKFNDYLKSNGFNLASDGRPILGLTVKELLEIMLNIDERMVMIPAHAWTPWFGIFGSKGGYNNLGEAFLDLTSYIKSIETGLSSDPIMNWCCSWLDDITLISNSDAHSCDKLGREANTLIFESEKEINYQKIMNIVQNGNKNNFLQTIEFYPEEGKYHFDGHRDCKISFSPEETKKRQGICPVCGRNMTVGVMSRVFELADRSFEEAILIKDQKIPYVSIVPLKNIIADSLGVKPGAKKVQLIYLDLIQSIGNELDIILNVPLVVIKNKFPFLSPAIERVRTGNIHIVPGYDGEFGVVHVFKDNELRGAPTQLGI